MKARARLNKQKGVMLLEALIAILIFSIGILAVVGMQAASIANVSEAKYRTDASFLSNELMGRIWTDRANIASFAYAGSGSPPAVLTNWIAKVQDQLPGAAAHPPTIEVKTLAAVNVGGTNYTPYEVKVKLLWQRPEEAKLSPAPDPHEYTMVGHFEYCVTTPGSIAQC